MAEFNKTNVTLNTIKVYIFPTLVTILAMLIWRDINEMRADVKMLLAQSNVDKTKIENLQRDVNQLEQAVFGKKVIAATDLPWFMKVYFKHEDIYDVNKYLKMS